jgi:hypothetical protein
MSSKIGIILIFVFSVLLVLTVLGFVYYPPYKNSFKIGYVDETPCKYDCIKKKVKDCLPRPK